MFEEQSTWWQQNGGGHGAPPHGHGFGDPGFYNGPPPDGFGYPPNGYEAPPQGFGAPPPAYGVTPFGPPQGFGGPPQGFGGPPQGFGAPPPAYGYEAPPPGYGYDAPPPGYGYEAPPPEFFHGPPPPGYGPPPPPEYFAPPPPPGPVVFNGSNHSEMAAAAGYIGGTGTSKRPIITDKQSNKVKKAKTSTGGDTPAVEVQENGEQAAERSTVKKRRPCIDLGNESDPEPDAPADDREGADMDVSEDAPTSTMFEMNTPFGTAFGSLAVAGLPSAASMPPGGEPAPKKGRRGKRIAPVLMEDRLPKKFRVRPAANVELFARAMDIISNMHATLDNPRSIPKAFWGLSKEMDKRAARYLKFPNNVPDIKQKALVEEARFPVLGVTFGTRFNSIVNFKSGIKKIYFGREYNKKTILPDSVTHVEFGRVYNYPTTLPKNLRKVQFCRNFNCPVELPKSVKEAQFGTKFNHPITLPEGLKKVIFGTDFFHKLARLPDGLEEITFKKRYNFDIVLPQGMRVSVFGRNFKKNVELPPRLEKLQLGKVQKLPTTLPSTIKVFSVSKLAMVPVHLVPASCKLIRR